MTNWKKFLQLFQELSAHLGAPEVTDLTVERQNMITNSNDDDDDGCDGHGDGGDDDGDDIDHNDDEEELRESSVGMFESRLLGFLLHSLLLYLSSQW